MAKSKRRKRKRKDKRKSKSTGSGKAPSMSPRMRELARAGHPIRAFKISDEINQRFKPGIAEEMSEATLLLKWGRLAEARDAFVSIIQREPRIKEAYSNLALAYLKLGEPWAAQALWQEAIERFPRYAYPRANLAQAYLRRGRVDEAEELLKPLEKVRTFHSGEFRFYVLTYSDVLAAQGDYAAALSWLNMLSQTLPDSPGIGSRRIRYWIGRLLHWKK